ncbi:MAG: FMN-binding protein [Chitinivibrionales bacterium]|nr:FMN-binding protein [Chitinivibrionales bacterium]MBD3396228.1 FMN-binding protein [Chitinivibrionales bacterium]
MNKSSPAYILTFTLIICAVFGTAVSLVHHGTRGMLEKNKKLHRNRVIARAFELDVPGESAAAYARALENAIQRDTLVHKERAFRTFTHTGQNHIGFVFSGMGFWDAITGILVLTGDLERVVNIQFLEQKETPGLGARIEEPWFTRQFKGLRIDWDALPAERIIVGPSPDPDAQNRVDAITGATQTSIALMRILNEELDTFRKARTASASERL